MTNEIDDGVIKFNFKLDKKDQLTNKVIQEIESYRKKLFKLNLIGEYKEVKIGFGNLSYRTKNNEFIISATQTGKYPNLTLEQYTLVTNANLDEMKVEATGKIPPSSESLTHFAIYKSCPHINYIFHIHHKLLWEFMLKNKYIKTKKNINYGTNEMAIEAIRCIQNRTHGIFVMTGHEDGIIAYGESAQLTYLEIEKLIEELGIEL